MLIFICNILIFSLSKFSCYVETPTMKRSMTLDAALNWSASPKLRKKDCVT